MTPLEPSADRAKAPFNEPVAFGDVKRSDTDGALADGSPSSTADAARASVRFPTSASDDEHARGREQVPGLTAATYLALRIDPFEKDAGPIVERLSRHHGIVAEATDAHLVPPGYYEIFYDKDVYLGDEKWVAEFALRPGCRGCTGSRNTIRLKDWIKEFRELVAASDAK